MIFHCRKYVEAIARYVKVQRPGMGPKWILYWQSSSHGHQNVWKSVTKCDGVLLLLLGVASVTVHRNSWAALAETHKDNATPTKAVSFDTSTSLFAMKGYWTDIGGGYYACEFDLPLIGQYLTDTRPRNIPKKYAYLFEIWDVAMKTRRRGRKETEARGAKEGREGRTVNPRHSEKSKRSQYAQHRSKRLAAKL